VKLTQTGGVEANIFVFGICSFKDQDYPINKQIATQPAGFNELPKSKTQ